jgi:hypothetical protein
MVTRYDSTGMRPLYFAAVLFFLATRQAKPFDLFTQFFLHSRSMLLDFSAVDVFIPHSFESENPHTTVIWLNF